MYVRRRLGDGYRRGLSVIRRVRGPVPRNRHNGGRGPGRAGDAADAADAGEKRLWQSVRRRDRCPEGRVHVRCSVQPPSDTRTFAVPAAIVLVLDGRRSFSGRPKEELLGQRWFRHQIAVEIGPFFRVRQDFGSGTVRAGEKNLQFFWSVDGRSDLDYTDSTDF